MLSQENKIYHEVVILSAMINGMKKEDILKLSMISKNNSLIDFVRTTYSS